MKVYVLYKPRLGWDCGHQLAVGIVSSEEFAKTWVKNQMAKNPLYISSVSSYDYEEFELDEPWE